MKTFLTTSPKFRLAAYWVLRIYTVAYGAFFLIFGFANLVVEHGSGRMLDNSMPGPAEMVVWIFCGALLISPHRNWIGPTSYKVKFVGLCLASLYLGIRGVLLLLRFPGVVPLGPLVFNLGFFFAGPVAILTLGARKRSTDELTSKELSWPQPPKRVKQVLIGALICIVGFTVGVLVMYRYAVVSVGDFLDWERRNCVWAEERKAIAAATKGDFHTASFHYWNASRAQSDKRALVFSQEGKAQLPYVPVWRWLFGQDETGSRLPQPFVDSMMVAMLHGKLAIALEKIGRQEDAKENWAVAEKFAPKPRAMENVEEWVRRSFESDLKR